MAQADADADADDNGSATRLTSAGKKELAELRREKRRPELDNEIFKRAAGGRPPKVTYRLVRELGR